MKEYFELFCTTFLLSSILSILVWGICNYAILTKNDCKVKDSNQLIVKQSWNGKPLWRVKWLNSNKPQLRSRKCLQK